MNEMKYFISKRMNLNLKEDLISSIIYIIENDNEISEKHEFFINPYGTSMTKSDIRKENNFCLDSFLVGVIRYIEENRAMENVKGKDTLDLISEKKTKNGPRTYNLENMQSKLRKVNVIFEEPDIEKNESENISHSKNKANFSVFEKFFADIPKDDDYYISRKQFLDTVKSSSYDTESSDMEIYYKSSELRKKFVDIKAYVCKKEIDIVDLDSETVTEFKEKVVYKYTGMCSFEYINNNNIITSITYNEKKMISVTSEENWINRSLVCNYIRENRSRCCECYFVFDQGSVFKFLQIGDVEY